MNKQVVKFLEFRGKNLVYLSVNGTYWIAIKPICEVLNIDYVTQFKKLKTDTILAPALCKHTMQVPGDNQLREYICLPEEFIYGWIFSIHSKSKELELYKRECYHVLYEHFHGIITRRRELIKQKADTNFKRRILENILSQNSDYNEFTKLRLCERRLSRKLKEIEQSEMQEELDLFSPQKDNQ
jgi:hypothetical protein